MAKPGADPFDLLCHLAFNAPVLTRRQRAERVKKKQAAFFNYFGPEARETVNDSLANGFDRFEECLVEKGFWNSNEISST